MSQPLAIKPPSRPLVLFDGDCGYCRAAVDRWQAATGDQIEYAPYQERQAQFPQLDERELSRAVHFIDTDGTVSRGAEAVFRAMARCGRKPSLLWLYTHVPLFPEAADATYRFIAANRNPLTRLRRIWFGRNLKQPTYHIASTLFLRGIGLIYLIAFVSFWVQLSGLIGDHGISPASDYLAAVERHYPAQNPPASAVWNVPTLAWINSHDGFLNFLCGAGVVVSVMLVAGLLPLPSLVLLWVLYLSLFHAGQVFLGFQWDILLLEAGFLAIFVAPFVVRSRFLADPHPPRSALWLVWWLLFRLLLESGAVKLTWTLGATRPDLPPPENTWTALTALNYHYWTQPLPIWTSWYAARFPEWFQKLSVLFVFVVELGMSLLIFAPRKLRYVACSGIILLMVLIAATGNYNFFNLLTILLALTLLDDRAWPKFLQRRIRGIDWPVLARPTRWRSFVFLPLFALIVLLGSLQLKEAILPAPFRELPLEYRLNISQFCLVSNYGLFRRMTETRPEILIEGSDDATNWKTYEFRWKPGDLSTAPRLVAPHQPRLDWQMWFEALQLEQSPRAMSPWFQLFLMQLLKGEPQVLALLADNPFPNAPPKQIRISLYQYQFTTAAERSETGHWWRRELVWTSPGFSLPK